MQTPEQHKSANWDSAVIKDIRFIKRKLRYPMNGTTLMPFLFWAIFIPVVILLAYTLITKGDARGNAPGSDNIVIGVGILGICIVIFTLILIGYTRSLKFDKLSTPLDTEGNLQLLKNFLQEQQLLAFRHPEVPEIVQIQSRVLKQGDIDEREIVVFIATERAILINSHFSSSGWSLLPARRQYKFLAHVLRAYINNLKHSAGDMHQTF